MRTDDESTRDRSAGLRRARRGGVLPFGGGCGPARGWAALLWLAIALAAGCTQPAKDELRQSLDEIQQRRAQARRVNEAGLQSADPKRQHELFKQAVALDERFGEAHNNLGVVLQQMGRHYEAAVHLRRAADLLPGAAVPYANLASLHGALHQWERALGFARKAHERDETDVRALRALVRSLLETGEDSPLLIESLERLAMRDPAEHWRRWASEQARLQSSRGRHQESK